MTREELLEETIKSLNEHHSVAIQAATGSGKSYIALKAAQQLGITAKGLLILVAERAHIDNWKAEITKWDLPYENVTIACYASMHNYVSTFWDCIIFDEAHHLQSDLRMELYSKCWSLYRIFLSATLKESLISSFNYYMPEGIGTTPSIKFGLQEAINTGIIAQPKIFCIPLTLNNKDVTETIIEEWGKKEKRIKLRCSYKDRWKALKTKVKYPDATLTIECTQQQKYDYITEQFDYYKRRYMMVRNEAIKNKWLQCGSKRKNYLGLLKTEVASKVIKSLKRKRFICFCTNIAQAEALGGKNAIHSKKKDCLNIVNRFNDKKISNIFAVGMLQEGVNLVDIKAGIIVQLDGEERAFIQKLGRALRSNSPEQYILYFKSTRDEEYLNNALEGINKDYVKYLEVDEINN